MSPLERSLAAADVITHEKLKGDVPLEILALPFSDGQIAWVPILVSVPGSLLDRSGSSDEGMDLGLYVYVTDESGHVADYFTRAIRLNTAQEVANFAKGGMVYYGVARLLPGSYRVRVFVRNEQEGRFGFQVADLQVPEFVEGALHALSPVFLSDASSGIRIRDVAVAAEKKPEPFQVGDSTFVPAVVPHLLSGSHSRVCLMVYRKGDDVSFSSLEVDGEIVDSKGSVRSPAAIHLIGRTSPDSQGLVKILFDLSLADLSPGEYSLRFTIRDVSNRSVRSESETKFRVS